MSTFVMRKARLWRCPHALFAEALPAAASVSGTGLFFPRLFLILLIVDSSSSPMLSDSLCVDVLLNRVKRTSLANRACSCFRRIWSSNALQAVHLHRHRPVQRLQNRPVVLAKWLSLLSFDRAASLPDWLSRSPVSEERSLRVFRAGAAGGAAL